VIEQKEWAFRDARRAQYQEFQANIDMRVPIALIAPLGQTGFREEASF
jgi:hypothetical protein